VFSSYAQASSLTYRRTHPLERFGREVFLVFVLLNMSYHTLGVVLVSGSKGLAETGFGLLGLRSILFIVFLQLRTETCGVRPILFIVY
jgi:hypothetical protein